MQKFALCQVKFWWGFLGKMDPTCEISDSAQPYLILINEV